MACRSLISFGLDAPTHLHLILGEEQRRRALSLKIARDEVEIRDDVLQLCLLCSAERDANVPRLLVVQDPGLQECGA